MKSTNHSVPGHPELHWCWSRLSELKPYDMYDLLALREAIFVVEQSCIYQELDGLDKTAVHLLIFHEGSVVACLRLLPPGVVDGNVRIGRVAVSTAWRKYGLARFMVNSAIEKARSDYPSDEIHLDAQTYLQAFYLSLGFKVCGDEFLEDGIPHIPMKI